MSVDKIKEMIHKITEMLVDNQKKITVVLSVDKEEVGKIIGRSGQTAKALRALVNAAATRMGKKVLLEIRE